MPRVAQYESQVIATPSGAVVAAARRISGSGSGGGRDHGGKWKSPGDRGWQDQAWRWYDTIGEFRFACSWVGNVLSRACMHVQKGDEIVKDGDAYDALLALFGGPDGQKEMFRQLGIQFTVAGEAYIIAQDGGNERTDKWWVVASTELTRLDETTWKIGKKEVTNPLIIRVWRPHPRQNKAPDSPTRAVLPVLSEIDGLTKHVAAQIDSRLAGAGMLLLPDNISFAGTTTNADGESATTDALDPFLQELMQTMMTAIKNREDASALVPIILQANGEYLDKVRHLTFSTPLDEQALELRKEAIRRLALGMDMPPEVLTGTGDVNHWGAWQIEDASIKAHTEPLLQIILSSLTEGYLWPYLEGAGMDEDEARDFRFVADTSQMRLRPDRSKEAIELFDRAVLGPEAVLTENGFDVSEAMTDQERRDFFTRKVASGMTTPELVAAALSLLGVNLPVDTITVSEREHPAVDKPSLKEHPAHDPPDPNARRHRRTEEQAMAEVVVLRALERAGNRIKSKYRDKISLGAENVKPHTLHRFTANLSAVEVNDVLLDAWTILGELPKMETISVVTLDNYVRYLFANNLPHDSRTFQRFLEGEKDG
jgi:hypothetical protein